MLVMLALRSLVSHRLQSGIVGGIILGGCALAVVGSALLDSVQASMARSVTASLSGHLQVYSDRARDPLALFGSGFFGVDDIGEIDDFAQVQHTLEALPQVRAVVPMGSLLTSMSTSNDLERAIGTLRHCTAEHDAAGVQAAQHELQSMAQAMRRSWENKLEIAADASQVRAELDDLDAVATGQLFARYAAQPEGAADFLDSHLAPLGDDGQIIYLRSIGTDLPRFVSLFNRFRLVEGEPIAAGHRGFLLAKHTYEKFLKNRLARDLDDLERARSQRGGRLADDPSLQRKLLHLPQQYSRMTFSTRPGQLPRLEQVLRAALPEAPQHCDVHGLARLYLRLDDSNFAARYAHFYAQVAPLIHLHAVDVGDTLTLRSFTRSGYLKSANVHLYGTFEFRGLESSDLAGSTNLMDMQTFRDLYGQMGASAHAELAALKAEVGTADMEAEAVEGALFAGPTGALRPEAEGFDEFAELPGGRVERTRQDQDALFDQASVNSGLALHAAIVLQDEAPLAPSQRAIEQAVQRGHLGLKVVDWQTAAGLTGQFIVVLRLILYVALLVIFVVGAAMMNNAMVSATMQRVTEIGTMRAMGAQRSFVVLALLVETLVLALIAGCLGAALGVGVIHILGRVGVAAHSDVMVFIFSGPRLYPTVTLDNVVFGLGTMVVVSVLSTLYPARLATSIAPVVAMQGKD